MLYPWYETITNESPLEQGDIIQHCNLLVPDEDHYRAILAATETSKPISIKQITGIVLSQSCDIVNDKIESLIICPLWPLQALIDNDSYFASSKGREELRRGNAPAYHLLNKIQMSPETPIDYYFVDFHHIYSVPKSFISEICKKDNRIRLLPPYREHLSQSFARYFMRVGLPSDISSEEIKTYSSTK